MKNEGLIMLTGSYKTSSWSFIFATALIILSAVFIRMQMMPIDDLPSDADNNVFSAGRAFDTLTTLTDHGVAHTVDSEENRQVAERIIEKIQQLGFTAEQQKTQVCLDNETGSARCTHVNNIIVTIDGTESDDGILLSAHYDSVPSAEGASDAMAAVATLLETLRLVRQSTPPKNRLVFLFNEGEEYGLMGARAFMREHPQAKNLKIALNIEARGTSGQSVMFETAENSGWLVDLYSKSTPAPLTSSIFYEAYKILPNDTDLTVFKEYDLQGLNFAHGENLPHYHTPLDNSQRLDKGSLQHHGDNVWGVLKTLKDSDLTKAESGNKVFTDYAGLFVISWDESNKLLIASLLIAVSVTLLAMFKLSETVTVSRVLLTVLSGLLIVVIVALVGMYYQYLMQWLTGKQAPWTANGLPMRFGLWLVGLIILLTTGRIFLKRTQPIESLVGLSLLWSLLSIAFAFLAPGVTIIFALAAMVTLGGLVLLLLVNRKMRKGQQTNIETFAIVTTVLSSVCFIAMAFVFEKLLTFHLSIAVAAMIGLGLITLLPIIVASPVIHQSYAKAIISLGVLWILTTVWAITQQAYSSDAPQHLNIRYIVKEGEHRIALHNQERDIPDAIMNAFDNNFENQAVYPWSNGRIPVVKVDSQRVPTVSVSVDYVSRGSDGRVADVLIDSPQKDFFELRVFIPKTSELITIQSGEDILWYDEETAYSSDYYEYRCRGDECAKRKLRMSYGVDEPLTIMSVAIYKQLPEQYQYLSELKGETAVSVHDGDKTVIISEHKL
ncbi:MAG: M20/M25/M40 family metallo-hydrolase [Kangiella sp.]|nr:M20/M25/M40 family metallo-hydrolase [Kangiella sp.]